MSRRASGDSKACQIWSNHIVERMQVDIRVIHEEISPSTVCRFHRQSSVPTDILTLYIVKSSGRVHRQDNLEKSVFGKWVERIRGIYIHRGDARASLRDHQRRRRKYLKRGFLWLSSRRSRDSLGWASSKHGSFKLATKPGADRSGHLKRLPHL